MSLYGNVAKVGSSTFQFDRVYSTRAEMDLKARTDKVYAGRYVLVEYGERFTTNEALKDPDGDPILITVDGQEITAYETKSFVNNKKADLKDYGAIYDSTVWQKIYTSEGDKYIMVAELNATVPKIDFKKDSPITYIPNSTTSSFVLAGSKDENGVYDVVKINNAEEKYNEAYFDTAVDTELSYQLHIPKNLQLNADNSAINYNEKGFNIAYSYGEDESGSVVGWISDGLEYTKDGQQDIGKTELDTATISGEQDIDSKTLYMNFPAFGNTINTLYDLLYGKPESDDLSVGVLRPYFEKFLSQIYPEIPITVKDNDNQLQNVTVNGVIRTVSGIFGEKVPAQALSEELNKTIEPSFVKIVYWDGSSDIVNWDGANNTVRYPAADDTNLYFYRIPQPEDNNSKDNIIQMQIPYPTGETDPDMEWLKSVPEISELLENNTAGLATVLQSLFGYADPLTGTTKYYLYADWQAEENINSSMPAISNKPGVVGGYDTNFKSVDNYYVNKTNDNNILSTENKYNEVETVINDINGWSDGNYIVNFDTWQLERYVKPQDVNYNYNLSTSVSSSVNPEWITSNEIEADGVVFNETPSGQLQGATGGVGNTAWSCDIDVYTIRKNDYIYVKYLINFDDNNHNIPNDFKVTYGQTKDQIWTSSSIPIEGETEPYERYLKFYNTSPSAISTSIYLLSDNEYIINTTSENPYRIDIQIPAYIEDFEGYTQVAVKSYITRNWSVSTKYYQKETDNSIIDLKIDFTLGNGGTQTFHPYNNYCLCDKDGNKLIHYYYNDEAILHTIIKIKYTFTPNENEGYTNIKWPIYLKAYNTNENDAWTNKQEDIVNLTFFKS